MLFGSLFQKSRSAPARKLSRRSRPEVFAAEPLEQRLALSVNYTATSLNSDGSQFAYNILIGDAQDATGGRDWYMQQLSSGGALLADNPAFQNAYTLHLNGSSQCTTFFVSSGDRQTSSSAGNISPTGIGHYSYTLPSADPLAVSGSVSVGGGLSFSYSVDGLSYNRVSTTAALTITPNDTNAWSTAGFGTPTGSITTSGGVTKLDFYTTDTASPAAPLNLPQFGLFNGSYNYFSAAGNPQSFTVFPGQTFNQRLIVDLAPVGSSISINSPWQATLGNAAVDGPEVFYSSYTNPTSVGNVNLFATAINVEQSITSTSSFDIGGQTTNIKNRPTGFNTPTSTFNIDAAMQAPTYDIEMSGSLTSHASLAMSQAGSFTGNPAGPAGNLTLIGDYTDVQLLGSVNAAQQSYLLRAAGSADQYQFTTRSPATGVQAGTIAGSTIAITHGQPAGGKVDLRTDVSNLRFDSGVDSSNVPYAYTVNIEEANDLIVDAVGASSAPIRIRSGTSGTGNLTILGSAVRTVSDLDLAAAGTLTLSGSVSTGDGDIRLAAPTLSVGNTITAGGNRSVSLNSAIGATTISSLVQAGGTVKESVRVATTAPITLSGTQTVDGVALVAGDRVLVKNQTTPSTNGIYVVVAAGAWTRATDANTSNLLVPGFTVAVIEGTQEGSWTFRNAANPTVGSTGLSFVPTTASVVFNPVLLASTGTLTLSGVGQTIDGQTVAAGDRILAKNQTNSAENGIYVAAGGQWARASDADTKEELRSGAFAFVTAGTANGGKGFALTNDAVEVGTTPLTFQAFSVASPRTNVWSPANVLGSADVATTINIALSGLQTIDGVLLSAGNRVLVKNQAKPAENGVYVVAAGAWSRATDADTAAELPGGTTLFVKSGTQNRNTAWNIDNSITQTATTVSNSAVVNNLFSTAALSVGMLVLGAGIPANTTIAAINPDGQSIRLSANATLSGSNTPLSFLSTQAITLGTSPIRFLPVGGDVAVTSATDITGASRLQGSTVILTAGAFPPSRAGLINALTNAGEVIAVAPGSITLDNAAPVQLTNVRTTVAGAITATSKGTLTATLVSAVGQPGTPPVPGNVSLTSQFGDVVAGNVTSSTLGDIALVASNANVLITTGTATPATVSAQGGNVTATADFGQIQVDGNVQAQGPGSDVVFSSANGTIGFTALANVFATDQLLISVPRGTPTIASGSQFTAAALNYTAQFGGSSAPPPSLGTSYGTVTLNRTDTGNIDYTVSGALTVAGASTSNGSIAFTAGDLTISAPLAPGGTGNDVALTATASDLHINDTITSGRNLTLSAVQGSIIDQPNAKLTVPGVLTVNALNSTTLFTRAGSLAATLTAANAVLQVTEDDALDIAAAGIRSFSTILTLAGNLTQTGSVASSSLAVTNTNGTVSLTNASNDVSSLAINNVGRAVSYNDANGFDIGPAGIQGSAIALNAAGSLTQSGAVTGTSLAVTNSAGPVTLTNALNNVASLSIANSGRPASYTDANGFDVGAAGIQGSVITLNAAGDVTQTGAITGPSLAVNNTSGSVSLTNAANDVSSLSITNPGGPVSFTDANSYNVTGLTGGAVVLRAAGTLSQSAAITATSLSVFNNGSDIALATQVNNVGTFSASNGSGKVQFQNGVTPLLIAGITGGPVTLQAAGAVSETAPINAASLNMIGSGADINLVSQVNNVGSFTASNGSGAVMLQNGPNPLSIGAVTGGYVYFNSPGAVSQTAPITASTLTVGGTGANTIDLSTQVNQIGAFTGNNGSGAIKLQTGSNPLSVGALAGGYVYLQPAGPVSQTGAITASTLTVGGSGSAINLGTQANSIGTFNFNNGAGSVSIRDAVGDLVLGTASAGAVSVQAAGVLTQSTAISATSLAVTGTGAPILLHTQPNNVGSFSASNGLGQVLFQSGASPVSVGPITGGYVYLQAGGPVSQSAAITADTLTVGGVGSAIALTAPGNAIGTFNVSNGYGAVSLTDSSGGLTLGYVHTGDFSATTVGDLVVTQPVEAGSITPPGVKGDGNISLTSTNANILINANLTALQDMVTFSAINGTITQAPATLIACETLVWYAQSAPSLNSTATVLGVNQTSAGDLYMPMPYPGPGPITIAASSTVNGSIYIKAADVVIAGPIVAGGAASKVDITATSGNVTFDTAGSVTNASGSGGVLIAAAGSIIDNHPAGNDVTALSATLTASTGSVGTLANPLETSVNALSATANAAGAAIAITNDKALTLQSISATGAGSTAAIQAAGAISQSGAILANALTVTGNGSAITLNTQSNQIGTFSASNNSGAIAIKDTAGDLVLGSISGGAVSVTQTSGAISQSAPTVATSLSVTGSGQAISLDTQANSIGSFSATNGSGSVSIKDTVNGLSLGAITAGNVSVTSTGTGAISQTGKITATALNVTGNGAEIQLHTQANAVGTFSASNGAGSILFQNGSSPLVVRAISGGYVYLQVAGAVSQSGAISATTLTVGGSGQPIALGTQANSIGTFNVSNGAGAVSIKDATGDLLVGYAYTGPLNVTAAGKVSISQVIAAGNIGIVTPGSLYVGPAGSPAPLLKSSTLIDLTGVAGAIMLANSGTISAPTVLTGGKTIDFGTIATATQLNQAIASVNAMPNSAGLAYQLTVTQSFVLTQTIIVSNAIVLQGSVPGTTLYGSSSVVNGLYLTSAASGSTIKNLAFGYFNGGTAVTLNGAKNTTLTGLTLSNSTTGLYVTGDSTGTSVVSNTIVNNQYGMQLVNATNLTVGGLSSGSNTVSYSAKAAVFASGNCVGSKVLKTLMSHNTVDYDVSASRNLTIVK